MNDASSAAASLTGLLAFLLLVLAAFVVWHSPLMGLAAVAGALALVGATAALICRSTR
jgi:hypothetical protein